MASFGRALIVFGLLSHLERHGGAGANKTVVFAREMCRGERELYTKAEFLKYLEGNGKRAPDVDFDFLDYDAVCDGDGVSAILEMAWSAEYIALVGSAEQQACEMLARVARYKRKPFISWACLEAGAGGWRVEPTLRETAGAVSLAADAMRWSSVVILSAETGWWWELAHRVELGLLRRGLAPRHLHLTERGWRRSLARLHAAAPAAVIICASHRPEVSGKILKAFDSFHIIPSMVLLIDFFKSVLPSESAKEQHYSGATAEPQDQMLGDAPINIIDFTVRHLISEEVAHPATFRRANVARLLNIVPKTSISVKHNKTSTRKVENTRINVANAITTSPSSVNSIADGATKMFFVAREGEPLANDVKINIGIRANNIGAELGEKTAIRQIIAEKSRAIKQYTQKNKHRDAGRSNPLADRTEPAGTPGSRAARARQGEHAGREAHAPTTQRGAQRVSGNQTTAPAPPAPARPPPHTSPEPIITASTYSPPRLTPIISRVKNTTRENHKYKRRRRSARKDNLSDFFYFDLDISRTLQDCLLVITDKRKLGGRRFVNTRDEVFGRIDESLSLVERYAAGESERRVVEFTVYDRVYESSSVNLLRFREIVGAWRPVLRIHSDVVEEDGAGGYALEPRVRLNSTRMIRNFEEWLADKGFPHKEEDCDDESCVGSKITMTTLHIFAIIALSLLLSTLLAGLAVITRNLLLKRKNSKRPSKIILMANDFVFPQLADSRRVDEGMEAMLSCWLQQLQEFGGPEVDKPDLLKGSVGSLKALGANVNSNNTAKIPSSNGSIAKSNCIVDPRTRYNGDLVQMKYLPNVGTFELKRKASDLLVLMHGLRHENLNPFVGCLCEPSRPAMVFEYCSRGSLEDVLVADEIKLDWTFRLSLLTDLVRGMRYLHTTTLRTHGHLTSRNCVVDARWVLKLTDYGMPALYRAQGIPPPLNTPRELLWSAPELLREPALRERGSQPGDVYSFAIVMQEVVVRGEPYCMLSLTPEEIIEKLKRPPPLIRPSVSKGAAPPEAINIMRQCWTEAPDMRPDFNAVHDLFRRLNHGRKVNFIDTMFQMLEKYSNNLEELIKERTEQLDMEKKKTEQLLNRMLPSYVAEKLKLGMPVDPEEFSEVSIYFSDIVGFTSISAHSSPFQVVDLLNDLYTTFDATINHYNVYKVETIGDAYMVVGGLPVRTRDHAEQVATMALHLLHHAGRFRIRHLPRTPLRLRIGLHTGPCCAGVVGLTMPRYCLFGDTVNTASRMESTGAAWRIHLSQATRDQLEAAGGYLLEYRGPTEIKGKGKMHTYWLLGKAGFDNPLPTPPALGLEESLVVEKGTLSVSSSLLHKSDDNSSECSSAGVGTGHASPRLPAGAVSPRPQRSFSGERSPDPPPGSHHFSVDRSHFRVEATTQQVIDMRKLNYVLQEERGVSNKQSSSDATQNKPTVEHSTSPSAQEAADDIDIEANVERTSADGRMLALNAPVSAVEVAAALLGASTTSLAVRRDFSRYKRSTIADADLSTPYNHYKCLSPSDSHLNRSAEVRGAAGRLLKRQFSLDRADELAPVLEGARAQARLCKQNSAGAAHDLEKIEEVPAGLSPRRYRTRPCAQTSSSLVPLPAHPTGAMSVSAESLTDSRLFLSSTLKR